jgi:hypothetical protein
VASASAGITFFEKIFFTVSGVGQKLKPENFVLTVPDPLLHPAWAVAVAMVDPDPAAVEKKPPEVPAAGLSPAAAEAGAAAAAAIPAVPAGVSAMGAAWMDAAASGEHAWLVSGGWAATELLNPEPWTGSDPLGGSSGGLGGGMVSMSRSSDSDSERM